MSKQGLIVYVCTGKECRKAWHRLTNGSPGKWLKRHVEAAELPFKLQIIKTECMDRCDQAGNLCIVHGECARQETDICSPHDADRLLASLRSCVEASLVEKGS